MEDIFFERQGSGDPIILIHGFPMNHTVWHSFANGLAKSFTVYTPDLPGFGESKILPSPFTIDDVAEKLLEWIVKNSIQRSVIIGHSLGGYVALAMINKRPDLFAGLGLFHSTALADSPEKQDSRTKVADFVEKNGALAFTSNFIQALFRDPSHPGISHVRDMATKSSAEAVIGFTLAMRDRPNRENVLKNFSKPILFIAGLKDAGIPVDSIRQLAALAQFPDLHIITNAAHMGMIEEEQETLEIVESFVTACRQPGGF